MRGRKDDGDDADPTACFLCGTTVPSAYRVTCARCKAIYYCSARCRDFHSRRYGHAGEECRRAAAEAAMTEVGAGGGGMEKDREERWVLVLHECVSIVIGVVLSMQRCPSGPIDSVTSMRMVDQAVRTGRRSMRQSSWRSPLHL